MAIAQDDYSRYLRGTYNQNSQNNYAAGVKRYGPMGRDNPTSGPVDKSGYRERDAQAEAMRNAMLRKLKAQQKGQFASSNYLNIPRAIPPINQMMGWYT